MHLWSYLLCLCAIGTVSSKVTLLWPTVLETSHYSAVDTSLPDVAIDTLATNAIDVWRHFLSLKQPDISTRNDDFYRWQQTSSDHVLDAFITSDLYIEISSIAELHALRYLSRFKSADLSTIPKMSFNSWFAVHSDGEWHGHHTHTGDSVVVVFYARIGRLSGKLMLFDPRGYISPFGRTHEVQVKTGDIVIFPPWLSHTALPSKTEDPNDLRVMFAFNFGLALHSMDWHLDVTSQDSFDYPE